jgi:hypothetical protein
LGIDKIQIITLPMDCRDLRPGPQHLHLSQKHLHLSQKHLHLSQKHLRTGFSMRSMALLATWLSPHSPGHEVSTPWDADPLVLCTFTPSASPTWGAVAPRGCTPLSEHLGKYLSMFLECFFSRVLWVLLLHLCLLDRLDMQLWSLQWFWQLLGSLVLMWL